MSNNLIKTNGHEILIINESNLKGFFDRVKKLSMQISCVISEGVHFFTLDLTAKQFSDFLKANKIRVFTADFYETIVFVENFNRSLEKSQSKEERQIELEALTWWDQLSAITKDSFCGYYFKGKWASNLSGDELIAIYKAEVKDKTN